MKRLILILLMILIIPSVLAAEWDNVNSYDESTRTYTITNALGLGDDIAQVKLVTPHLVSAMPGIDRKVAEIDINLFDEEYLNFISSIELINNKNMQPVIRNINFKYKTLENERIVDDFEYVCDIIGYDNINQSNILDCYHKKVGNHTVWDEVWHPLKKLDFVKGNITIGIFSDVEEGDNIEWFITVAGDRLNEWATWTSSFDVNLKLYYNLSNVAENVYYVNNLTLQGTPTFSVNSYCAIAGCVNMSASNTLNATYNTSTNLRESGDRTMNYWIYPTANNRYVMDYFNPGSAYIWYHYLDGTGRIECGKCNAGASVTTTNPVAPLNTLTMLTFVQNGSNILIYVNGTYKEKWNQTDANADISTDNLRIGWRVGGATDFQGYMDELAFWERQLSASEISDLYNSGAGISYEPPSDLIPTVVLNTPLSANYSSAPQTVNFNCTAYDDIEVSNVTLYINSVINYTKLGTGTNFSELYTTGNLPEGTFDFYCEGRDSNNGAGVSATNRIIIDQTAPTLNVTVPLNNSVLFASSSPISTEINVTIADVGIGLQSCWYTNSTENATFTCGSNITLNLNAGSQELKIYANDTFGNEGNTNVLFYINVLTFNSHYSPYVIEGENSTVQLNITATNTTSIIANLTYNNTDYSMNGTNNGTFASFLRSVIAPIVSTDTNISLQINFSAGSTTWNTSVFPQTVYNIPPLVVSAANCSPNLALYFNLTDEQNFTLLNGTIEYNFAYGSLNNNTYIKAFGTLTNAAEVFVCVNSTISQNWKLGRGELFYRDATHVDRRFYLFEGTTINSTANYITLYDLLTSEQTSFKLEVEDTSLNPYVEKFTALLRWYPNLDQYKIVEMGQTDEKGDTVIHTQTEDVDYRIAVYERNGTLIKLEDPTRMVCLVDPCTYTLRISPTDTDYTSFFDVTYTFTYNETTKIWTFIFSDSSQRTSEMNMTIFKVTGTSVYAVCSDTVSGYTGVLTCNTSAYSGKLRGEVYRSASPEVPIAQKIIDSTTTAFKSPFGLFISLIIGIPIVFAFAVISPLAAVLGGVIAVIPAYIFGTLNLAVLGGIAILAGITLHFLKRV